MRTSIDHRRLDARAVATGAAAVLLLAATVIGVRTDDQDRPAAVPPEDPDVVEAESTEARAPRPSPSSSAPSSEPTPDDTATPSPTPERGAAAADEVGASDGQLVVPDAEPAPPADSDDGTAAPPPPPAPRPAGTVSAAQARFEQAYPAHAAARQDPADPATTRWALLIGINDHYGRTRDNLGSRQDAESLAAHLRSLGWRDDHVLTLVDRAATRETIIEGIRWLSRKTNGDSVAVFHYSGHTKQWHGQDVDGDGEVTDEGLWPADNRHITDREWVDLMRNVSAGRLWIDLMGCEAAGYVDPGLVQRGRIITFSSAEAEKSYEDPSVGHSVWGWNLIVRGLREGLADGDGDGDTTVQEAATFAIPRAARRTREQRPHGPQNGGIIDRTGGALSLAIPAPPPPPEPEPDSQPSSEPDGCLLLCGSSSRRGRS